MEPLPKKRSDEADSRQPGPGPQWSRSRRSGATAQLIEHAPGRKRRLNGAAPEEAERRLAKNEPSDLRRHTRLRAPASAALILVPLCSCQGTKTPSDPHASAPRHLTLHRSARTARTPRPSHNHRARYRQPLMIPPGSGTGPNLQTAPDQQSPRCPPAPAPDIPQQSPQLRNQNPIPEMAKLPEQHWPADLFSEFNP